MSTAQDLSTFHKRLLWARQQARLTQEQVAGLGNMSQANPGRWGLVVGL